MSRHFSTFLLLLIFQVFTGCEEELLNRVWVHIDPIQCLGNPWEEAWLEEHDHDHNSYPKSESERLAVFERYYEEKGVEIYDRRHEWVYEVTCSACSCPNGDRIHCQIDEEDLVQMLEWGFMRE